MVPLTNMYIHTPVFICPHVERDTEGQMCKLLRSEVGQGVNVLYALYYSIFIITAHSVPATVS